MNTNKLLQLCRSFIRPTSSGCGAMNTTHPLNLSPVGCFDKQSRCIHGTQLIQRKAYGNKVIPSTYDRYVFPEPPQIVSEQEHDTVLAKVNECIASPDVGRLFAVIVVSGSQFKVTEDDLIQVVGLLPLKIGERIRLEKVLLVGGSEFTLVGRPLVRRNLVKIEATVVEKTPGVDKVIQRFRARKRFDRKYLYTPRHTVLRINSIQAFPEV